MSHSFAQIFKDGSFKYLLYVRYDTTLHKKEKEKNHNYRARDVAPFIKLLPGTCEALVSVPVPQGSSFLLVGKKKTKKTKNRQTEKNLK